MKDAACGGSAYEASISFSFFDPFFPKKGQPRSYAQINYCLPCTVKKECALYYEAINAKSGIWGGNYHEEKI